MSEHAENTNEGGNAKKEGILNEIAGAIKKVFNAVRMSINSVLNAGKNIFKGIFGKSEKHASPELTIDLAKAANDNADPHAQEKKVAAGGNH